jgi:hypothetical protein
MSEKKNLGILPINSRKSHLISTLSVDNARKFSHNSLGKAAPRIEHSLDVPAALGKFGRSVINVAQSLQKLFFC